MERRWTDFICGIHRQLDSGLGCYVESIGDLKHLAIMGILYDFAGFAHLLSTGKMYSRHGMIASQ